MVRRRHRILDPISRQKFPDQREKQQHDQKRRQRLYNRLYRKSYLFILAWGVRMFYILLFSIICFWHNVPHGYSKEVVLYKEIETYTYISGKTPKNSTDLTIQTSHDKYVTDISGISVPDFNKGDTLIIERNVFDKPIYFSEVSWSVKYSFGVKFAAYFAVLFITLISFAFNNGLDLYTNKLLKIIIATDLLTMGCYFLN